VTGFIWSAAQQHEDGWQILPKQGSLRGFLTVASRLALLLLLLDLRPLAGRLRRSVAPFSLVRQPEVTLGQDVKVQARRWVALLTRQLGHIGGLLAVFLSSAHSDR
jgi:hypothetical protein